MPAVSESKYLVSATWDDVPHLSKKQKEELWESIPPYQRDARTKGIPQLGSGAIWPIQEERISCDDFEIPEWWPRAFSLDVGWRITAALWGAWDKQSDTVYVYSEYKQGLCEPATHVTAIQSRGAWIPGVIDPASCGSSQMDGKKLIDEYRSAGLELSIADNSVEAGIHAVYKRFVSGRLKIFKSCRGFFEEFRLYRRDENGKIVKENDHLCDNLRYLVFSGMKMAIDQAFSEEMENGRDKHTKRKYADDVTGY